MSSTGHLYILFAIGAILSGINYFVYRKLFDVKVLEISAAADYFASSVSRILPQTLITGVDPPLLDNISSGLMYAELIILLNLTKEV
jgi:hypothetical protein